MEHSIVPLDNGKEVNITPDKMGSEEQLIHKLNEATDRWRLTRSEEDTNKLADTLYNLLRTIKQRDYRLAHNLAWCIRFGMGMPSKELYDRLNDVMASE